MKQKTYPLKIKKKIKEGRDACTLILSPKKEDENIFLYKPAQFLSFHLNIGGESIVRSYSLSGSPLLGEPLTTSIKKVKGGRGSNYLVDEVSENQVLESTKPLGKFFKAPANLKPRHYFIVAGGSGITPLFSVIKTVLLSDDKNTATLVYCNQDEASIIYKQELSHWAKRCPKRLRVEHFLSRQKTLKKGFQSRLSPAGFQQVLTKSKSCFHDLDFEYYLCGPAPLMKMSEEVLITRGVQKKQIRKESFGTVSLKSPSPAEKNAVCLPESAVVISAEGESTSPQNNEKTLFAVIDGERVKIPLEKDIPLLEQLISAGHSPPFSCMAGSCMTCMAVLKKGQVYQDEPGILAEENISAKEILTCQAKPLSSTIEVDYDS